MPSRVSVTERRRFGRGISEIPLEPICEAGPGGSSRLIANPHVGTAIWTAFGKLSDRPIDNRRIQTVLLAFIARNST